MFNLALQNLENQRISSLNDQAKEQITVRGFHSKWDVPMELKQPKSYLPVNLVTGDYCPTDRFLYLAKSKRSAKRESTWQIMVGSIIDDTYEEMFTAIKRYLSNVKPKDVNLFQNFAEFRKDKLNEISEQIKSKKDSLMKKPSTSEIKNLLTGINHLLIYEQQLAHVIINYLVSLKGNHTNLKSEVEMVFPFITKAKFSAISLGFSKGSEPDFIFNDVVIGDIKTGEWRNSFYLTLAAYALIYEKEKQKEMNLGIIINPQFLAKRNVPYYENFEIVTINDLWRKTVLTLRDKKLEMIIKKTDPGLPKDDQECKTCGYYNYCWSNT